MKPAYQTVFGERGDCFRACVASLLGVETTDLSHYFAEQRANAADPNGPLAKEMRRYGFFPMFLQPAPELVGIMELSGVYYVLTGRSPRLPNQSHAVVFQFGKMAHDPMPGDGPKGVRHPYDDIFVLVSANPERHRGRDRDEPAGGAGLLQPAAGEPNPRLQPPDAPSVD